MRFCLLALLLFNALFLSAQDESIPSSFFTGVYYLEHENFTLGISGESVIPGQIVEVENVPDQPNLRKISINGADFVSWETKDIIIDLSDNELKLNDEFNYEISCQNSDIDVVIDTAIENEPYINFEDDILVLNYLEDVNLSCGGPFNSDMKFYKNGILTPDMEPFILTFEVDAGDEIGFDVSNTYQSNDMYTVDWGDDTFSPALTSTSSHTYENGGTYDIKIWGQFSAYLPGVPGQNQKILEVKQWGDIEWNSVLGNFQFTQDITLPENEAPNLENVTSLNNLFRGSQMNANINHWDVSNVVLMSGIFEDAPNFNQPLDQWDVSNIIFLSRAFKNASSFNQNIHDWDVSNVTNMIRMFKDAESFNQPLNNWDISGVSNLTGLFKNASNFNQELNNWDVSNVTNFIEMFEGATNFNQDLNDWNTSSAIQMTHMFRFAENFNGAIGNWDLSSLESMVGIFTGAKSFNQDIENWDVSGVVNFARVFQDAESFNQPLNNWDVSNSSIFAGMFNRAYDFNQSLESWDMSGANLIMFNMFRGASSFNQPINSWELSNANISSIFYDALIFNQPLDLWDFSDIPNFTNLFKNSGLDVNNYELLLSTFVEQGISDVTLNNDGLVYCDSTNRDILINDNNVEILNDSLGLTECTENAFITTWQVEDSDLSIIIPTSNSYTYDFIVDWGDGNISSNLSHQDDTSHTYEEAGIYEVRIFSEYPHFATLPETNQQSNNIQKLQSVEQWGKIQWKSFRKSFKNATQLIINATDIPNLQQVESMREIFKNASLVNFDMSGWVVSQVKNFQSAFEDAVSFNHPIGNWNTNSAENMSFMFKGATSFNQNLNDWNTEQVTTMESMFEDATNFNGQLNSFNLSNLTNMKSMFKNTTSFNQPINEWDVSNVITMEDSFRNAINFNQPLNNWNVSQVNTMFRMFSGASNFDQNINTWNVEGVINMNQMFRLANNFNQPLDNWNFNSNVNLGGFLNFSGYQTTNYDSLLSSFSELDLTNKNLGAATLLFCNVESRDFLINQRGWTIAGDTKRTDCDTYSIEDFELKELISIYPNPSQHYLFISAIKANDIIKNVIIYNVQGKLLSKNSPINSSSTKLNIIDLKSGVYWINVTLSNGLVVKDKVIKID